MRFRTIILIIGLIIVGLVAATASFAVSEEGAAVFRLDPSVRAAGMGTAGNAVFWGGDPNDWANPALLGYHRGLRFSRSETDLQADLGIDSQFQSDRVTIGVWGLGLLLAGKPIGGLGGLDLTYGPQRAVDESGNVIGTFSPYEEAEAWGIGLSLAEFGENLLRWLDTDGPALSRYGDLSLGYAKKSDFVFLAPGSVLQDARGGSGEVDNSDRGLFLRLTPYDSIDRPGAAPSLDAVFESLGGLRLDLGHARATQSYRDEAIVFVDAEQADAVAKVTRKGWSIRLALGLPPALGGGHAGQLRGKTARWLTESLTPLLSLGVAWDRNRARGRYPVSGEEWEQNEIKSWGWELTVANVFSLRRGHIENPDGLIEGDTSGWSLGFRVLDFAGFRYDKAETPRPEGQEDLERKGWTIFFDGLSLWRGLQASDGG